MIHKILHKFSEKLYQDLYMGDPKNFIGVPSDISIILDILSEIKSDSGIFLDLGCGIGNVLSAAEEALENYKFIGVDNNTNYLDFALGMGDFELHLCDLLSSDVKEIISISDIIYTYAPFSSSEKMRQLIDNITNNQKIGSYFILNSYGEFDTRKCKLIKEIDSDFRQKFRLYQKT